MLLLLSITVALPKPKKLFNTGSTNWPRITRSLCLNRSVKFAQVIYFEGSFESISIKRGLLKVENGNFLNP